MAKTAAEWNLGFAYAEVVARLEKMLEDRQVSYRQEETDAETCFHATLPHGQGRIELTARPVQSSNRPALLRVVRQRTFLSVRFRALGPQQEKAFMHGLSIAFLRVGG